MNNIKKYKLNWRLVLKDLCIFIIYNFILLLAGLSIFQISIYLISKGFVFPIGGELEKIIFDICLHIFFLIFYTYIFLKITKSNPGNYIFHTFAVATLSLTLPLIFFIVFFDDMSIGLEALWSIGITYIAAGFGVYIRSRRKSPKKNKQALD